jgi:2-iminoacetate synthase ThiH
MIDTVRMARTILSPDVIIQVSAVENSDCVLDLVKAGARDIGELSLNDENDQYARSQQLLPQLEEELSHRGFQLEQRLPIFSPYIQKGWYPLDFRDLIRNYFQRNTPQTFLSKLRSASQAAH